jgi:DNA-binding CsgD family transcriptional regulator
VLSEREMQVFELIGSGAGTLGVAAMLNIGPSTVESYRTRIKVKMNLKDAEELLRAAIRWNVAKSPCGH